MKGPKEKNLSNKELLAMRDNKPFRAFRVRAGWLARGPTQTAFTLIELLVVIVSIAILAALLLPVLASAKAQSLHIQCLNNQKQLVLTWVLYASDNAEKLVPNGAGQPRASGPYLWVLGDNHFYRPGFTDPQLLINPEYALFAPYLRSAQSYKCPADRSTIWTDGRIVPKIRSYAMNCYVGTPVGIPEESFLPSPGYRCYTTFSQIAADLPTRRFVFMDVNPANICWPAFGVDEVQDIFFHYPSTLHEGCGGMVFADAHAESHKWLDPRTRITVPDGKIIGHWTLSPTNSDLYWIRERTTTTNLVEF
jgi:hypothetical protein